MAARLVDWACVNGTIRPRGRTRLRASPGPARISNSLIERSTSTKSMRKVYFASAAARPADSAASCASIRSVTDTTPRAYASVTMRGSRSRPPPPASTDRWKDRSSPCDEARRACGLPRRPSRPPLRLDLAAGCVGLRKLGSAAATGDEGQRRLQRHAPRLVVRPAGHWLRPGAALARTPSSRSTPCATSGRKYARRLR